LPEKIAQLNKMLYTLERHRKRHCYE